MPKSCRPLSKLAKVKLAQLTLGYRTFAERWSLALHTELYTQAKLQRDEAITSMLDCRMRYSPCLRPPAGRCWYLPVTTKRSRRAKDRIEVYARSKRTPDFTRRPFYFIIFAIRIVETQRPIIEGRASAFRLAHTFRSLS